MDQKMDSKPTTSRISVNQDVNNSSLSENQLISQCEKIQETTREKLIQLLEEQNCLMKNLMEEFVRERQNLESNVQDDEPLVKQPEEIVKELEGIKSKLKQKEMLDSLKNIIGKDLNDTTNRVLSNIFPNEEIASGINWSGRGKNNKISIKNYPEIIEAVKRTVRKRHKDATDPQIEKIISKWFQNKGKAELRKTR